MGKPGSAEHIVVGSHEDDQGGMIPNAVLIIRTGLKAPSQVVFVDRTGPKEKTRVVMQRGMLTKGGGWSGPATQSIGKLAGIQKRLLIGVEQRVKVEESTHRLGRELVSPAQKVCSRHNSLWLHL